MRARLFAVLGSTALVAMLATTVGEQPLYSHKPITTTIIYKKEIAQIFQRKCFNCHSENNLAMPLTTYELARPWARAIREDVLERRMPPWGAVTGFGHFSNDVSLTQREMDIILSWADGGAPSGVLKVEESIPPVYVPAAPMWEVGEPDEVIAITQPFTVEAGSGDQIRTFELKSQVSSPRFVKALAFKPGDRRVVRYAAIYEARTGRWLWTWTPWQISFDLPDAVGYKLPARAALRVELGYRATEETVTDQSEIGLYFGDTPARRDATPVVIAPSAGIAIKAGSTAEKIRAETILRGASRGLAIWPDLGEGAKSVEISSIAPDGVVEPLLWVKDVRADWPTPYVFRSPIPLSRGTRLVMTTYYENPTDTPRSVKPRVTVMTAP
jgi:hypothetical protein